MMLKGKEELLVLVKEKNTATRGRKKEKGMHPV
jgi:hypothetical protein